MDVCESWDSNWMDGSCAGFDDNLDNHDDAETFEAGLEPLPTWDGAAYSPNVSNNNNGSRRRQAATERQRRCEVLFLLAAAFRVSMYS